MRFELIFLISTWTIVQADLFQHGYPKNKLHKITAFPKLGYPEINAPVSRANNIQTFETLIDHFGWFAKAKFTMRFASNGQFFNGSGPMIVMIGGQNPIDYILPYLNQGLMYDAAHAMLGYMFVLEHRYYGESVPNLNLEGGNLRYLKTRQVLADIVAFINNRKANITALQNSSVIVFGGGYAGNLATWLRLKYPTVVAAAVASSAPVQATVDFYEYFEMVQRSINTAGGSECLNIIKNTIDGISTKLHSAAGVSQLQTDFGLCEPLNVYASREVTQLFANVAYVISNVVQSGNLSTIRQFCNDLKVNASTLDDYTRVANYYAAIAPDMPDGCFPSYQSLVGQMKSTGINPDVGRSWLYQMCTEYGYFTSTSANDQPFSSNIPTQFFYGLCKDVFGYIFPSMTVSNGVSGTNNRYGGLYIKLTKVVTTQGSLDPWSSIGLTQDISPMAPVIVINGTGHSFDLLPASQANSNELSIARTRILDLLQQWT